MQAVQEVVTGGNARDILGVKAAGEREYGVLAQPADPAGDAPAVANGHEQEAAEQGSGIAGGPSRCAVAAADSGKQVIEVGVPAEMQLPFPGNKIFADPGRKPGHPLANPLLVRGVFRSPADHKTTPFDWQ